MVIDALTWVLLLAGSFFLITGALGLLRMPEFFTRVHAAGLIDTLGALLLLIGLMLYMGWGRELFKTGLIIVLFLVTGPATVHVMCKTLREQEKKHSERRLSD